MSLMHPLFVTSLVNAFSINRTKYARKKICTSTDDTVYLSSMKKQTAIMHLSTRRYLLYLLSALALFGLVASLAARHNIGGIEENFLNTVYGIPHVPSLLLLAITQLGSVW